MAIPSVELFSNQPGGGLVAAMKGQNALTQSNLENQIKQVQAQYAPLTVPAKGLSELTYAMYMQPQYAAKLLEHENLAAQLKGNQVGNAVNALINPINGQGTSGGMGNIFDTIKQLQSMYKRPASPFERFFNWMSGGNQQSQQVLQQNTAPNYNQAPQPTQTQPQPQPSYTPQQGATSSNGGSVDVNSVTGTNPNSELGQATTAWMKSPEAAQQAQKEGMYSVPPPQQLLNWYRNQQNQNAIPNPTQVPMQSQNQPEVSNNTYAENIARTKGIIKEGEELGGARGKAISDLGKQYMQDIEAKAPLDHLAQIAQSPIFMNMRKDIPYWQGLQLNNLSKIGNPAQQKMIGDFITSAQSAVGNTVKSFGNRPLVTEFKFANMMKVNPDDTLGVIIGKLESLITYKNATMQRNEIARQLMQGPKHMNEGDAYQEANKQVNMDKVRENVASNIQTPIKLKNKKTGEIMYISPKDYNEMLQKK